MSDDQQTSLVLRQTHCKHAFIPNGKDPICVHCGVNESKANELQVQAMLQCPYSHPGHVLKYYYRVTFDDIGGGAKMLNFTPVKKP